MNLAMFKNERIKLFMIFTLMTVLLAFEQRFEEIGLINEFAGAIAKVLHSSLVLINPEFYLKGNVIRLGQYGEGVTIDASCSGIEYVITACITVSVFSTTWKEATLSIVASIVVVQFINLIRVCLLLYTRIEYQDYFDVVHEKWAPFFLITTTAIWVLTWIVKIKQTSITLHSDRSLI